MEINDLYHFLFETYEGVAILVLCGMVLSIIASVIFEIRTKKIYKNYEAQPDEWAIMGEEFEEGEQEELEKDKKIDETAKE